MPVVATDPFKYTSKGPIANSPGTIGVVTPSDVDELSTICRMLYCGGVGGNVRVKLLDGSIPPAFPIAAGEWLDRMFIRQVLSTGTTATNLVGFV